MTLEISTTGAALLLHLHRHRHHVRLPQQGPTDQLTRNLTSVAWTPLLPHVVHLLPYTDLQSSLPSTRDRAVRPQEILMKVGNLTVHHAHLEPGIPRRLLL
jgi:hypothetical protein